MSRIARYSPEPLNPFNDQRQLAREEAINVIQDQSIMGTLVPQSVPIDAVRRKSTHITHTEGSNYTISATTFTEVDSAALSGTLECQGGPIIISANIPAAEAGAAALLAVSFTWRGEEVSGVANGLALTESTSYVPMAPWIYIADPGVGTGRFALVALRATANGTIFADANNMIQLLAREV